MNKKNIITIALVVLIPILLALGAYLYFFYGSVDPDTGERRTLDNLFPQSGERDDLDSGSGQDQGDGQPASGGTSTPAAGTGAEDRATTEEVRSALAEPAGSWPRLYQITNRPVAGATALTLENEDGQQRRLLRYIDRRTGHIHQLVFGADRSARITAERAPGTERAVWSAGGQAVLYRQVGEDGAVTSSVRTIREDNDTSTAAGPYEVTVRFLPDSISAVAAAPDSSRFFYLQDRSDQGEVAGVVESFNGQSRETVFSSPIRRWQADWSASDSLTLTTKPSAAAAGYSFKLKPDTGEVSRLLGDLPGLTAQFNPDGSTLLYSWLENGRLKLGLKGQRSAKGKQLLTVTLPEKCAWGADSTLYCGVPDQLGSADDLPDSWYQHRTSFQDRLGIIKDRGDSTTVLSLGTEDQQFDITEPFLGPEEEYLFFINKLDGTLWSYRLP